MMRFSQRRIRLSGTRRPLLSLRRPFQTANGRKRLAAVITSGRAVASLRGCALGWIGAFAFSRGELADYALSFASGPARMGLGIGDAPIRDFYDRMDTISAKRDEDAESWRNDAVECARCLRLYAAKYHAPQPAIPDSVREIFSE